MDFANESIRARFNQVKLLLCDVDGVLTDGTVTVGGSDETKRFNIRDGLGLLLLQKEGLLVGWVSNRPSPATQARADELGIDFLVQDKGTKATAVESILQRAGVTWNQTCYVGDDVVDLAVMRRVGAAVAVGNAIDEVAQSAHYVTIAHGGHGAVREVVELILKAQEKWMSIIKRYSE